MTRFEPWRAPNRDACTLRPGFASGGTGMLLVSSPTLGEAEKSALRDVVESGWITMDRACAR